MVECIEREAFLDAIERMKPYHQDADDIAEMLQNFPAADVRPVVKAHWIKCNRGAGYKCSVCKARSSYADVLHGNHKFCYKCGAMMEEI